MVERVVRQPEQIVAEHGVAKAYQSRVPNEDGTLSLVRVIVDDAVDPLTVITVYRTSKIAKYWRGP